MAGAQSPSPGESESAEVSSVEAAVSHLSPSFVECHQIYCFRTVTRIFVNNGCLDVSFFSWQLAVSLYVCVCVSLQCPACPVCPVCHAANISSPPGGIFQGRLRAVHVQPFTSGIPSNAIWPGPCICQKIASRMHFLCFFLAGGKRD